MYQKVLMTLLILGILIFATVASAEIKFFEGVGEYYMENSDETLAQAQDKAKLAAELKIIEQAQVHIQSYSEMNNSNLTQDEIVSITAGIINVTNVKYSLKTENDGILLMCAVVTAEIDTDKISELVEREINRRVAE